MPVTATPVNPFGIYRFLFRGRVSSLPLFSVCSHFLFSVKPGVLPWQHARFYNICAMYCTVSGSSLGFPAHFIELFKMDAQLSGGLGNVLGRGGNLLTVGR